MIVVFVLELVVQLAGDFNPISHKSTSHFDRALNHGEAL